MLVGIVIRHQQPEHQIHRPPVDRVEIHALLELDESADGLLALAEPAMGQGHPMAQTRAPQALPADQAVEDRPGRQIGLPQWPAARSTPR